MTEHVWKLQDAKARFSELVRRARGGELQRVTVHGKDAVVVVDPARYEVKERTTERRTLRDFIERSRQYRLDEEIEFERSIPMNLSRPAFGEDDEQKS